MSSWYTSAGGGAGGSGVGSVGLTLPTSVFGVANSPLTSNGTIAVTFLNQNSGLFLAGATTGGVPSFRTILTSDLPALVYSFNSRVGAVAPQAGDYTANMVGLGNVLNAAQLVASNNLSDVNNAGTALTNILPVQVTNSGKFLGSNGTAASWQTVSVGLTLPTSLFSVAGSPTSNGTLAGSFITGASALALATPTGASGVPTLRQLVESDILNLTTDLAGKVATSRLINTTAPLAGGGTLAGDLTLNMPQAGTSASGWLSNTDWNTFNSKGTGSVTSVGLSLPTSVFTISNSPITSNGTLTGTFSAQAINTFFAGPSGGGPAVPTFRVLAAADLNGIALSTYLPSQAGNSGLYLFTNGTTASWVAAPTGSSSGGTGTVTSVGLSLPNIFNIAGSPITTAGTITGVLAPQLQNLVFAAPSNTSGVPAFRLLAATDIPALPYLYQAPSSTPLNIIQPTSSGVVALGIKQNVGSIGLFQVYGTGNTTVRASLSKTGTDDILLSLVTPTSISDCTTPVFSISNDNAGGNGSGLNACAYYARMNSAVNYTLQLSYLRNDPGQSNSTQGIQYGYGRDANGNLTADSGNTTNGGAYAHKFWYVVTPISGNGTFVNTQFLSLVQGTGTGTVTLLGGAISGGTASMATQNLLDLGVTTTDYTVGFTSRFRADNNGQLFMGPRVSTTGDFYVTPGSLASIVNISGITAIAAGFRAPILTTTTGFTLTGAHYSLMCNPTGSSFVVTLPAASSVSGQIYNIKKIDGTANTVTVSGATIDNVVTYALAARNQSITIQSDATQYWII